MLLLRSSVFLLACSSLFAADTNHLVVRVNDASPVDMSAADLQALPRHKAALTNHGTTANYEGVLVADVLRKAGVDFGKGLHGKQLSTYVSAIGSDGYEVVYALADFDTTVNDSEIMVADKQDGNALSEKDGPLRIVAPHDKKPARSVRMLKEIDVVQLRK